jgi:twitching motility protein PilT
MINQREVRVDTTDFGTALRAAMRQDPDVILVGEMRDAETVKAALAAAETGHFVMSTLHTTDAEETVNRIIDFFPPHEQKQVRITLAGSLKGIICQRLVPRADGQGRIAALEIMRNTSRVREMIEDQERTREIPSAIAEGHSTWGMQSFDQSVMSLYTGKLITYKEAMRQASNPDDFALRVRGVSSTSDLSWEDFDKGGQQPTKP